MLAQGACVSALVMRSVAFPMPWLDAVVPPRKGRRPPRPIRSSSRPVRPSGSTPMKSHDSRTRRLRPVPSAPSTIAVGCLQVDGVIGLLCVAARPTVQTFNAFNSSIARAMFTTSTTGTWAMAPADAFAATASSAAARRGLTDDAVRAGGIDGTDDCADVVRILDAVEHDEQRWTGHAAHELVQADRAPASAPRRFPGARRCRWRGRAPRYRRDRLAPGATRPASRPAAACRPAGRRPSRARRGRPSRLRAPG